MLENPILTNSRPEFKQFPKQLNEHLVNLGAPHVNSFNEILEHGFANCVQHMLPVEFQTASGERVSLRIEDIHIDKPKVPKDLVEARDKHIYPSEARQTHRTYSGVLTVRLGYSIDGDRNESIACNLGAVPIMLKSKACNLANLTPEQMVQKGEHDSEWGGIFIIKGNEKIVRMLLMTRRNFPISIKRSTWRERGKNFSDIGLLVRCVRSDGTSYNNVLHYLNNGTAKLMFSHNKLMSYVPVCLILKVLLDLTDMEIYRRLVRGYENDLYYVSCVENMLRELHEQDLHTQLQCKEYLGKVFRPRFPEVPSWCDDTQVVDYILNERIFIHLDKHAEKFDLLVFMMQKLYQCAQGHRKIENVDSVMMQEVLLPGHLYQTYLLDRLGIWLNYVKRFILKRLEGSDCLITPAIIAQVLRNAGGVQRAMESFLATGNAPSRSGLGLMQNTGLVVVAENINRMRYMSHFRAVHRGSFFTTMRTTEARQLLPDAWGFICPVHTPDGAPCGLLNHLTLKCKVSELPKQQLVNAIPSKLVELGMLPLESSAYNANVKYLVVLLDGKILGYIPQLDIDKVILKLRALKIEGKLPEMLEIGFIPDTEKGQFPGLFLFAGPARLMRPVHNIALKEIEYIGSLEQVYMNIAIEAKEAYSNYTTHMELSKTAFLSNLANLIPMPDHNQSPRNMYQCQMGKQTMGTPVLNWPQQAANKLYRLQTPATPLFRPVHYDNLGMDDFAMGTNAVLAVISYTGYDMEDAMIINKMAHERGFAYGSIYKTKFIELTGTSYFARNPNLHELAKYIDNDGLPQAGTKLSHMNPLYCYYDTEEAIYKVSKLDEKEDCIVDSVRLCGALKLTSPRCACITLRIPRSPTVGDKFASRAGQKGICSQRYPAEDLPFTEGGIIPDIVFNPHGFPSRMTIAMMIEIMAGKSSALHGLVHDATPFRFSEKHTPIDYFGKLLEAGGYNYFGTERLYSGVDGREMLADIFFGVVHYQRLRHMVFDKYQVRSTGAVDAITQQPIKGRKRGGGVRFGEMERDALISHGAAFLLQDRLFHNSDKMYSLICRKCGSILAPLTRVVSRTEKGKLKSVPETCRLCGNGAALSSLEIPASFKYLVTELSSVNINARLKTADI